MDLLLVGRPNAGKTLLMINFAAYLGVRDIRVDVTDDDGVRRTQRLSLQRARRDLVSLETPKTIRVQTVAVDVAVGRQSVGVTVVDTPGLAPAIAADPADRRQAALILERLIGAALVFHVIDASLVRANGLDPLDHALLQYGARRATFLVVANKVDRPGSHEGLTTLKVRAGGTTVIPVSSHTRRGFRDLRLWMVRTLA